MGLPLSQAIGFARAAGFTGEALVTIVAISYAECSSQACSCNPDCCPPGESCGVLQFYQPGANRACALDPACAYRLAWSYYVRRGFTPWSTFNSGRYLRYVGMVRAALVVPPPPPPTAPPAGGGLAWAALLAGGVLLSLAARRGRPGGL